jgi:alpha-beta hydrolase superfamily lysophospholipase
MIWQAEEVKASIPALDMEDNGHVLAPEVVAYNQYYGLDFEARIAGLKHTVGKFNAAGFDIVAHVYRFQKVAGTVYIHHGYYDHVGIYNHIIEHCLQQGFNVFIYDLPGHGLSSGERAGITSFLQYDTVFECGLKLIQKSLPQPLVVMGQSTGGAVIINYLLSRGVSNQSSPFKKIYLMAPLVRPVSWTSGQFFYYLVRPFTSKVKRVFAKNSGNVDFLKFISQQDPLQPLALRTSWVGALKKWIKVIEAANPVQLDVQVIQGTDDGTVDYRHNMKVLEEKFIGLNIKYVVEGGHQLVNEEHVKRTQVFAAMTPII